MFCRKKKIRNMIIMLVCLWYNIYWYSLINYLMCDIIVLLQEKRFDTNSIRKYHFNAIKYSSFTTILFRLQYLLKINRCFMQILMEIVFWFLSFYAVTLILQNGVAIQENMKHIWCSQWKTDFCFVSCVCFWVAWSTCFTW